MVQSKDLRVGNWVQDEHGIIQYVYRIWQEGVELSADATGVEDLDYESKELFGVPLTNEILKKCGFDEDKSNDVYERTIFSIQVANGTSLYFDAHKDWMRGDKEVEWYLSHEWNNNHFKNDFWGNPKYLHQLQNLYYCLTGEDLQYVA